MSGPTDNLSKKEQKPKKVDGKKTTAEAGKKVKKTPQPKKAPKTLEFVDTDSDDSDNEQEPALEQSQKASKTTEFVDTNMDNEQEQQPNKAPKTPEYSDDEQGLVVKCIVMYSTEDEQESTVKKLQKT